MNHVVFLLNVLFSQKGERWTVVRGSILGLVALRGGQGRSDDVRLDQLHPFLTRTQPDLITLLCSNICKGNS